MLHSITVTEVAFYCASFLSLILAFTLSLNLNSVNVSRLVVIAAYINVIWLASIAALNPFHDSPVLIDSNTIGAQANIKVSLFWETLHYSAWVIALIKSAQKYCKNCIPTILRIAAYLLGFIATGTALANLWSPILKGYELSLLIWMGIVFSIMILLVLEQLYRNMTNDRLVRLMCVTLAFVFLYDAFLFSQNLVLNTLDEGLWQIRASVLMVTSVLMAVGVISLRHQAQQRATITFSQPVVFYTTSLVITGALLIFLALGGYWVKTNQASWAAVFYSVIVCTGVISITLTFSSPKFRRRLNVIINKHLFHYKYDYRAEWLRLIRLLSQPAEDNQYLVKAISTAASLFKCEGGGLWRKRGSHFVPAAQFGNFYVKTLVEEPARSEFVKKLAAGWAFAPSSTDDELSRENRLLPAWVHTIDRVWMVFPLLVDDDLTGFMILRHVSDNDEPIWEDLDLVRTVGRQLANYLARHEQSELLAQARQFEAFNKLSAFVMHDLKNLIAQQSLVVKNAEKHKDNPAFVEDAINTIKNSVDRMNILLRKLKQNSPEETKVLKLKDILIEAIKRCQKTAPVPTLVPDEEGCTVKADYDSLVMVFTHLLHNAQDATPASGFIDVYTERKDHEVQITFEDNGEGMSEHFIRTKLFQPFESTKSGKGMGVGVYQAREYIESLGGRIEVESVVGQGTKFILYIPIVQNIQEE